jgi:predicted RNase H-like HicB family nuclease
MDLQLTAVFRKVPEGYIAFVEELPGANTQGPTLEEARANLRDLLRHLEQHGCEFLREGRQSHGLRQQNGEEGIDSSASWRDQPGSRT